MNPIKLMAAIALFASCQPKQTTCNGVEPKGYTKQGGYIRGGYYYEVVEVGGKIVCLDFDTINRTHLNKDSIYKEARYEWFMSLSHNWSNTALEYVEKELSFVYKNHDSVIYYYNKYQEAIKLSNQLIDSAYYARAAK